MSGRSLEAEAGRAMRSDPQPPARTGVSALTVAGLMFLAGVSLLIVGLAAMWLPLGAVAGGVMLVIAGAFVARNSA